jgi:hypothetical protein
MEGLDRSYTLLSILRCESPVFCNALRIAKGGYPMAIDDSVYGICGAMILPASRGVSWYVWLDRSLFCWMCHQRNLALPIMHTSTFTIPRAFHGGSVIGIRYLHKTLGIIDFQFRRSKVPDKSCAPLDGFLVPLAGALQIVQGMPVHDAN